MREKKFAFVINNDELVKSQKSPSPLMGEGRGEGE